MILDFSDSDGDPIAVDALAIVAVSVGRLMPHSTRSARSGQAHDARRLKPMTTSATDDDRIVTLIHTQAGPLMVAESYAFVRERWAAVVGIARLDPRRREEAECD